MAQNGPNTGKRVLIKLKPEARGIPQKDSSTSDASSTSTAGQLIRQHNRKTKAALAGDNAYPERLSPFSARRLVKPGTLNALTAGALPQVPSEVAQTRTPKEPHDSDLDYREPSQDSTPLEPEPKPTFDATLLEADLPDAQFLDIGLAIMQATSLREPKSGPVELHPDESDLPEVLDYLSAHQRVVHTFGAQLLWNNDGGMFRGPTVTQLQPGIQGLLLPNALQRAARVRRRSMDDALGYNVEMKGKARRKSEHMPGKGRELAAAELTVLQAELKLANFVEPGGAGNGASFSIAGGIIADPSNPDADQSRLLRTFGENGSAKPDGPFGKPRTSNTYVEPSLANWGSGQSECYEIEAAGETRAEPRKKRDSDVPTDDVPLEEAASTENQFLQTDAGQASCDRTELVPGTNNTQNSAPTMVGIDTAPAAVAAAAVAASATIDRTTLLAKANETAASGVNGQKAPTLGKLGKLAGSGKLNKWQKVVRTDGFEVELQKGQIEDAKRQLAKANRQWDTGQSDGSSSAKSIASATYRKKKQQEGQRRRASLNLGQVAGTTQVMQEGVGAGMRTGRDSKILLSIHAKSFESMDPSIIPTQTEETHDKANSLNASKRRTGLFKGMDSAFSNIQKDVTQRKDEALDFSQISFANAEKGLVERVKNLRRQLSPTKLHKLSGRSTILNDIESAFQESTSSWKGDQLMPRTLHHVMHMFPSYPNPYMESLDEETAETEPEVPRTNTAKLPSIVTAASILTRISPTPYCTPTMTPKLPSLATSFCQELSKTSSINVRHSYPLSNPLEMGQEESDRASTPYAQVIDRVEAVRAHQSKRSRATQSLFHCSQSTLAFLRETQYQREVLIESERINSTLLEWWGNLGCHHRNDSLDLNDFVEIYTIWAKLLMPLGTKRNTRHFRLEALDEWAAFTLHGSERFDWSVFRTCVMQLVERFAEVVHEEAFLTWIRTLMHKAQHECEQRLPRLKRHRQVRAQRGVAEIGAARGFLPPVDLDDQLRGPSPRAENATDGELSNNIVGEDMLDTEDRLRNLFT